MTDRRNFIAGVASSGWTAFVGLVTMPLLIDLVGLSAFGLVGVYLTLQGLFALLDLGFAPTISREVARARSGGDDARARNLVFSMAVVFTAIGACAAVGLALSAPWLSERLLNKQDLPDQLVAHSLALSALAIGARWPGTIYAGALLGAKRVDLISGISIASVSVANFGGLAILYLVEPSIELFFGWQIVAGLLHSIAMWAATSLVLGGPRITRFEWGSVQSAARFTSGMSAVALTGVVLAQSDKTILAMTSSLSEVGLYTIAVTVAGLLYRVILPAYNVVFPRLTELHSHADQAAILEYFQRSSRIFLSLAAPMALLLVICADQLVAIWIGPAEGVSDNAGLTISLLTAGTFLHCIMYFPFALQIAYGNTRAPTVINVALIVLFIPTLYLMSSEHGALGAAGSWLLLHTVYLVLGIWITNRYVVSGFAAPWLRYSVCPPLAICIATGSVAIVLMQLPQSVWFQLAIGSACAASAFFICAVMLPETRQALKGCDLISRLGL